MNKISITLIVTATLIFLMGLLMVFNTTSAEVLEGSMKDEIHLALIKQFFFGLLAVFFSIIVWRIGYKNLIKYSPFLLTICIIMLLCVFIPKISHVVNGARRWISIFGISMQPSELAKFILPMFFINFVIKKNLLK